MNSHRLAPRRTTRLLGPLCLATPLLPVWAQQATPAAAPPPAASAAAAPSAAAPTTPAPVPPRPPAAAKGAAQDEAGEPRAGSVDRPAPVDRVQLDATTVTGNQELPKVMYIVPWKKADIGDLSGKPMNSLMDEILAPVDRDVFRREVTYYQVVRADTPAKSAAPPKEGEK